MSTVGGLRPVQQTQPEGRQKQGRLAVQRTSSNRAQLSPSAAPVDTFVRVGPTPDVSRESEKLAAALAQLNPALGNLAKQQHNKLEREQLENLRFYTEQFMKDKEDGAVSAAQVKEVFPELVPTVAARIAQATGEIESRRWMQDQIQTILENDDIRLNTANRRAYLEQIREEARGLIGDNQFYGNGFLSQLDRSLNEFETAWMRETAAHQERIQAESFTNHVAAALMSGGDLMELDAEWKESSSLNHLQRNEIVVNTAISQALATGDEGLLARIPDRFLNAESKAKFEQTRQQLQQARYTQMYRARQMQEWARADQLRNRKMSLIQRAANGEVINPAEEADSPEAFAFAIQLNSQPLLNDTLSVRNYENFRSRMLNAATTGGYMDAFAEDGEFARFFEGEDDVTEEGLRDFILQSDRFNPAQKQALMGEVGTLMEGVNFVRNPDVAAHFEATVGKDVQAFAQSVYGQNLQTLGFNVQGDVMDAFMTRVREEWAAHVEDNDESPRGQAKLELLDRAADAAMRRLQFIQQNRRELIDEVRENIRSEAPRSERPVHARRPNLETNDPEPADENVIVLPNGVRVQRVE